MLAICHLQLHEGGRAGFPPKQVMLFWVLCSCGGCLCLTSFLSCTVKKCQLETVQKHFNPTRGTLRSFSVLLITDGGIARVFTRPPPMKHHVQTWRYFHRLFHLIRFQQFIPCSLHEWERLYVITIWSL